VAATEIVVRSVPFESVTLCRLYHCCPEFKTKLYNELSTDCFCSKIGPLVSAQVAFCNALMWQPSIFLTNALKRRAARLVRQPNAKICVILFMNEKVALVGSCSCQQHSDCQRKQLSCKQRRGGDSASKRDVCQTKHQRRKQNASTPPDGTCANASTWRTRNLFEFKNACGRKQITATHIEGHPKERTAK
jgi:hypothetical protein